MTLLVIGTIYENTAVAEPYLPYIVLPTLYGQQNNPTAGLKLIVTHHLPFFFNPFAQKTQLNCLHTLLLTVMKNPKK